jgi:hypothetical protein
MNHREAPAEHVAGCEQCFEACLKEFFEPPAEPAIPQGFAARTVARLPALRREPPGVFPYSLAAAGLVFVGLAVMLTVAGVPGEIAGWLASRHQAIILWVGGAELLLSVAWLWRWAEE